MNPVPRRMTDEKGRSWCSTCGQEPHPEGTTFEECVALLDRKSKR